MKRIIVLNAKGGCGKTTVATNLASCYAVRGYRTALIDYDPQGSSLHWIKERPPERPAIHGVCAQAPGRAPLTGAWQMRVPRDTQRVVVDTQAGVRAIDLVGRISPQDTLLIPIQPSAIDIRATADFIRDLLLVAKLRPQERRLAIIGNRTRPNAKSFQTLQRFLDSLNIPVLDHLRDSQSYAAAAEQGLGICELPPNQARSERRAWNVVFRWVEPDGADLPVRQPPRGAHAGTAAKPAAIPRFLTADWDAPAEPAGTAPDPHRLN